MKAVYFTILMVLNAFTLISQGGTIDITDPTIPSCDNGSISIQINTPFMPVSIFLSNGDEIIDTNDEIITFEDLLAGSYTFTIEDALCGVATGSFDLECCTSGFNVTVNNICFISTYGSIDIEFEDAFLAAFPLPFTVELADLETGVIVEYTVDSNPYRFTNLSVGEYAIYSVINDLCSIETEVELERLLCAISGNIVHPSCDLNMGEILIDPGCNDDYSPYQYEWSDGATTKDRNNLSPGEYCLEMTDSYGCVHSRCFELENMDCDAECPAGIPVYNDGINVCSGETTTEIDLFFDPNITSIYPLPYQIEITNITTGTTSIQTINDANDFIAVTLFNSFLLYSIEDQQVGVYEISVTFSQNCLVSTSTVITGYSTGISCLISGNVIDSKLCGPNGSISINMNCVNSSNEPFTYLWSDGSTEKDRNNLTPDVYCLTATDRYGCDYNRCFTVGNEQTTSLPNITVNRVCGNEFIIEIEEDCFPYYLNYTSIILNGNQNVPIVTAPPHLIINESPFILDFSGFGLQFAEITFEIGSAQGGQTIPFSITSETYIPMSVEVIKNSNTPVLCVNQISSIPLIAEASYGRPPYSYLWSTNASTEIVNVNESGTYCVTVTDDCNKSSTACYEIDCHEDFYDPYTWSCIPSNFGIYLYEDCPCLDCGGFFDLDFDNSDIDMNIDWGEILGTVTITWPDGKTTQYINNNGQQNIVGEHETEYDIESSGDYLVTIYADWLDQEVTCIYSFQSSQEFCSPILYNPTFYTSGVGNGFSTNSQLSIGCQSCETCGSTEQELILASLNSSSSLLNGLWGACEDLDINLIGFDPQDPDNPCSGLGELVYSCPCNANEIIRFQIDVNLNAQYVPMEYADFIQEWNDLWNYDINLPCPNPSGICIFEYWQIQNAPGLTTEWGENSIMAFVCEEEEEVEPPIDSNFLCPDKGVAIFSEQDENNPCVQTYTCSEEDPPVPYTIVGQNDFCIIFKSNGECELVNYCSNSCQILERIPNPDCTSEDFYTMCEDIPECTNLKSLYSSIEEDFSVDLKNSPTYKLYPNPSNNKIFVLSTDNKNNIQKGTVDIYSIEGLLIERIKLENVMSFSVDINDYAQGVYLVNILGTNFKKQLRFIKSD